MKKTLPKPEVEQPLGTPMYVSMLYGLPSMPAALLHAASETIFEKPGGQALVWAAPSANPAHNGARNRPPACPPRIAARRAHASTRRHAGAIERVCAQLRPGCVAYDGNIARREQGAHAAVSSSRTGSHARMHGPAAERAGARGSTVGEGRRRSGHCQSHTDA